AGVVLMLLGRRWNEVDDPEQSVKTVRTLLLSALVLLGATTLLRALTDGEVRRTAGDGRLRLLALAAVPAYLVAMFAPALAYFFELQPLSIGQWGQVLGVAVTALLVLAVSDWVVRPRPSGAP